MVYKFVVVILICLISQHGLHSAEIDLYTVTLPTESRSPQSRIEATRKALQKVLIRVTGQRLDKDSARLTPLFENPERHVIRYGFVSQSLNSDMKDQTLEVSFDPESILQLIKSSNLPVWEGKRSQTIAWIIMETDDGSSFFLHEKPLHSEETSTENDVLLTQADTRGIPLIVPLLDLHEREQIPAALIAGLFRDEIVQASKRYDADAILVGRLSQQATGKWQGTWRLWDQENETFMGNEASNTETLLAEAIDWIADQMSSLYAIDGSDKKPHIHWVQIDHINSIDIYTQVLNYFKQIKSISRIQVARVHDHSMMIAIEGNVNREQLFRLIQLKAELNRIDNNGSIIRLFWQSSGEQISE